MVALIRWVMTSLRKSRFAARKSLKLLLPLASAVRPRLARAAWLIVRTGCATKVSRTGVMACTSSTLSISRPLCAAALLMYFRAPRMAAPRASMPAANSVCRRCFTSTLAEEGLPVVASSRWGPPVAERDARDGAVELDQDSAPTWDSNRRSWPTHRLQGFNASGLSLSRAPSSSSQDTCAMAQRRRRPRTPVSLSAFASSHICWHLLSTQLPAHLPT
eukprot:scaffold482_cov247-Pinguiococcus_pyrenoidosus.AAC.10